jgi:hypothetical protein
MSPHIICETPVPSDNVMTSERRSTLELPDSYSYLGVD